MICFSNAIVDGTSNLESTNYIHIEVKLDQQDPQKKKKKLDQQENDKFHGHSQQTLHQHQ